MNRNGAALADPWDTNSSFLLPAIKKKGERDAAWDLICRCRLQKLLEYVHRVFLR